MTRRSNYEKHPAIVVSADPSECVTGWQAIAARVSARLPAGRSITVAECYPGTHLEEIAAGLAGTFQTVLKTEDALKSAAELEAMLSPSLGDDPVFGRMGAWEVDSFFDPAKVARMRAELAAASGDILVLGVGAGFIAEHRDLLLFCDVTRWEIQQRQRAHTSGNLGARNAGASPAALYKRAYFVDWRAADRAKHRLHGALDFYVDTNRPGCPKMIAGERYRDSLHQAAQRPFRVVPFFDPGVWGGEWMRSHFDLPPEPPNFAWCFDCVPEENSLCFDFGGQMVEVPALALVHEQPEALLGKDVVERFGAEFPIRFDFLDTVGGGNLSLQVHPLQAYIAEHFGMAYTQDESYYLLDAGDDAVVYLGLKPGIDRKQMAEDLATAQADGPAFPVDTYVNAWPVKKHDHVSIPAGTIHCSGSNSMVLEISATPYIFTFKLWDWGRLGLNGLPRPIHLEHGLANLQWDRDRDWVEANLIHAVRRVAEGEGWYEESTGLHALEFIETRRHWFTASVPHHTQGTVNVLNLVEGEEAVVESPGGVFAPFVVHYAETFIVPACVGAYRISPTARTDKPLATLKAYVRGHANSTVIGSEP